MIALGIFLGIAVALSIFFTIIASGEWARLIMLVATSGLAVATLAGMLKKARMAMMLEAIISLATLAIVAARAVNILK